MLEINELLEIFGLFLLVLIGIELLETIKTYLEEHSLRLQVVFLVALIAIARKVIILKIEALPEGTLVGLGVVILALSVGYFLVKRAERS